MVHFYDDRCTPSNYWKLDSGQDRDKRVLRSDMKRAQFPTNKATSTTRLRELFIRCQRGLLSYERLPSRDLKLFAAQRALPVTPGQKPTVAALKAQLEQADDDGTFDRFTDLPPELRQLVYTFYFKSLEHPVPSRHYDHLKCQPPITFASRDTRRESLPLFYESCVFLATTMWEPRSSLRDFTAALSPDSSAFFRSTSTHNFARIKRLDLYLGELDTKIVLDLNNTNDPVSVEYGFGFYFSDDAGFEAHVEGGKRVLIELCTIAMSIATREGPHKLQQSDLIHLYNTVRSILY